jgi:hypothetical protein
MLKNTAIDMSQLKCFLSQWSFQEVNGINEDRELTGQVGVRERHFWFINEWGIKP